MILCKLIKKYKKLKKVLDFIIKGEYNEFRWSLKTIINIKISDYMLVCIAGEEKSKDIDSYIDLIYLLKKLIKKSIDKHFCI